MLEQQTKVGVASCSVSLVMACDIHSTCMCSYRKMAGDWSS